MLLLTFVEGKKAFGFSVVSLTFSGISGFCTSSESVCRLGVRFLSRELDYILLSVSIIFLCMKCDGRGVKNGAELIFFHMPSTSFFECGEELVRRILSDT